MSTEVFDWAFAQQFIAGGSAAAADQNLLLANTSLQSDPENRLTYLVFLKGPIEPEKLDQAVRQLLKEVIPDSTPSLLFEQLGGFAIDLNQRQAERLSQRREVISLELDRPMRLDPPMLQDSEKNDVFVPQALVSYTNAIISNRETVPWGVRAIWQGRDISSMGNSGAGSFAFVIDSGVLATTGDLNLNTSWSRSWISGQDAFTDDDGHGTHVAGTIGALVNGLGMVGVAPGASIVSLKVFDSSGNGSSLNIIAAIDYAVSVIRTNKLDLSKVVINLSLAGGLNSALNSAMLNAANLGIRFAVAAGNNGADADTMSPASSGTHPNVYTVSAVDSAYQMPSWSNWDQVTSTDPNDSVDFAAPGVNVLSYYTNGALANLSGTSMASPHVAGALLMGGVTTGDMVKPSVAGTADPFAWAINFPGTTITSSAAVQNKVLWGTAASDILIGGNGNDSITGVQANGTTGAAMGLGQIDILTGGPGADTFLLGDSRGVFYDDRSNNNIGLSDYARITDFNTGIDKLQFHNGTYFTTVSTGITSIYWDRNGNNQFDTTGKDQDELIAMVTGAITSKDIILA
ncbi:S8 family serine peptidase [Cyanobium sp. WAJ14-Wanaka]|uniref:S8 family serine peptidase n=1 Tax=Cyanobium sp. WAJ14-Wanaka TaxID=2823725 RepID=UPI0020CEA0EA|nr:S8 family serine peptidase [Cyanobium sp. WAJ14-Wanaka]MCP9775526.1 S8 family serine peptidase [Cyanobium sp. WAJ14-Wanaka]